MSQTYDIFIYRLFLFSFEQRNQKDCRPIVFIQSKKLPTVLLKPFLHLNSTDPFRREKKSFAYKNFIYNQNPLSLKGFAERLRQFILNTLPLYTVVQSFDKVFYLKLPQELARTFSQTISSPFVLSSNSFPFVSFTFSEQQLQRFKALQHTYSKHKCRIDTLLLIR